MLRKWILLGCLVVGGVAAQEDVDAEVQAVDAEQVAYAEYLLAAAAQDGDFLSDLMLANALEELCPDVGEDCSPYPAAMQESLIEEQDRLWLRAEAAMAGDPLLLSLALACGDFSTLPEGPRCDAQRRRLEALAGGNAYYALILMTTAWTLGDERGFVAAVDLGARATTFDPAYGKVFASMRARFAAVPDTAAPGVPLEIEGLHRADAVAQDGFSVHSLPRYGAFMEPCKEAEGAMLGKCLAIARLMTDTEGTLLDTLMGAGLLHRKGDASDQALAQARRRDCAWLVEQSRALDYDAAQAPAAMKAYLDTLAAEGELPAMRARLRVAGVPVVPPADWSSPLEQFPK